MSRQRPGRYISVPDQVSIPIEGFPAVILGYRAEEAGLYRSSGEHVIIPGRYERDLIDWARELAPSSQQFVDCGAHAGSWSLLMTEHFREVHAFEPQRLLFQQLCGNAALNGITNLFAYNTGLDRQPGALTLHQSGVDRGSSSVRADIMERFATHGSSVPIQEEHVQVITLDSLCETLDDVGLIKIDVEGLEQRVLQGAIAMLKQNDLPKMLIECWHHDWYQEEKRSLLQLLRSLGYRVVPVAGYADMLLAEKN
jgi:FkbM family methyltransferase